MKIRDTVREQMQSAFEAGDLNGSVKAHHAKAVQTANKIIHILDSGSTNANEIAQKIGTTENTVRPVLQLLEDLQVVRSFYIPPVQWYCKAKYYQPSLF